jgi:hypothetical protein
MRRVLHLLLIRGIEVFATTSRALEASAVGS